MARWRSAAIKRLPEFREIIVAADSIMGLWIDLHSKFEGAYKEDPCDEDLIAQIYSYADWCLNAPRVKDAGHDPVSAVVVGFFENIPTCPAARQDMPRWLRYEDVAENKDVFSCMIGEESFNDLVEYMGRNRNRYVARHTLGATAR